MWLRYPIGASEMTFAICLLPPYTRKWTIFGVFVWVMIVVNTHLQHSLPQYNKMIAPLIMIVLAGVLLWLTYKYADDDEEESAEYESA